MEINAKGLNGREYRIKVKSDMRTVDVCEDVVEDRVEWRFRTRVVDFKLLRVRAKK